MTKTTMPAPATTLRERMIEDMKLQRLCQTTQRNYLRDAKRFAIWLGRPPGRGKFISFQISIISEQLFEKI